MTGTRRSLTYSDYTVGWISPLSIPEYVASRAMLDEIDEDPTTEDSTEYDNNVYTAGRIGRLNVVIACLPAGQQGDGAAARVAKDMVRSFRAIKIILLVGVGGGVPGLKLEGVNGDVRLGDVVVSLPSKNSAAVVQYDYGKSMQDRRFVRSKGSLNRPPEAALAAVANLRAQHEMEGNKIADHVSEMVSKYPRMARYARPGPGNDRPFKASYAHKSQDESCDRCCSFDAANLLDRLDRDELPVVHYGTIGSASQVMKDGVLRDEWAKEESIICFEMEAAGMMDGFPCLVIQGISNYADSHKNDIWQRYAAATAAAYAKELILVMNWQAMIPQTVRCRLPNVDIRHPVDPEKTLKSFRCIDAGDRNNACLGMQLVPAVEDFTIRVGETISVLDTGEHFYIKMLPPGDPAV